MTLAWIRLAAVFLCLLPNLQLCKPLEIFDSVISTRRIELVKMKAMQLAPLLQRIDNSLQRNLKANATCLKHMQLFVDSMMLHDDAGLELLDSLGSLPSGILRGSLVDAGSHEECFSANVTDENGDFVARKFCAVVVYHRETVPKFPEVVEHKQMPAREFAFQQSMVKIGICIPSKCTDEDFRVILNDALSEWDISSLVLYCDPNEPQENPPILVIFTLGFFVVVVTLATLLDVIHPVKPTARDYSSAVAKAGKSFMLRFRTLSVVRTVRETFLLEASKGSRLDVFNGLRALAMVWIIALHTHIYLDEMVFEQVDQVLRMSKTLPRQLMVNATMNVSVFMTISGFMQWMTVWKRSNNENGKAGWFAMALHRYLRMFPLVAIAACFHQLLPTSGRGPTWAFHTKLRKKAFPENWQHYLLGTLNFIDLDSICSPQHWFTSADFQLYVLILFFTIRLKRTNSTRPVLTLMVLAMLFSGVQNYMLQYPAGNLYFSPMDRYSSGDYVYYMPYSHLPSYCIGVIAGFWYTTKVSHQLSKRTVAFLWVAALCGICIAQFGTVLWTGHAKPSRIITALYAATHRGLFSAGIAWIIYACLTDRSGFLGSVLAWPGWAPLSRLSFSTYMFHDIMLQYEWTSFPSRADGGYYFMAILVAGNCVASLAAALVMHAVFEKPLALLATLLEEHFLLRTQLMYHGATVEKDERVSKAFVASYESSRIKQL